MAIRARTTTLSQSLVFSLLMHTFLLGLLLVKIPNFLPEPEIKALQVKLVTASDVKKVIQQKPVPQVKTQQSAAPKEAPKPKQEPKEAPKPIKKDVVKATPKEAVKTLKTPEPVPPKPELVKEAKPEPTPEMRPEKLDKTPNKKNIVANKDAELAEEPEDFLAALDFIKDLEAKNAALEEAEEETAPQVVYDAETNAYAGKIKKVINQNWYRPPGLLDDQTNYAIALVAVANDGSFKKPPYIKESSGNSSYDNSLLRGIKKSVPFPVLEKIPPEGVTFELRFGNFGNKQ